MVGEGVFNVTLMWYALSMTRKPIDPTAPPMTLSPQQKNALWYYASDMDIQQVADLMGISRAMAKEHLHRAYRSLGTSNVRYALKVAYETGIFIPRYIREDLDELGELRVQRESVLDASESLEDKALIPEDSVAKIQEAVLKLSFMASATPYDGLSAALWDMSHQLDLVLRKMGASPVESPLNGAIRALEANGMFDVNWVFVGVVLEDHPEIKHAADEWDWSDAEVRDKIAQHVICDMLGLSRTQYEQAIDTYESHEELIKRFWDAHEKWT